MAEVYAQTKGFAVRYSLQYLRFDPTWFVPVFAKNNMDDLWILLSPVQLIQEIAQ